ncbi:MAG TPA: PHP domain-containing protein, partial [Anaeromyxobacteraceae bacterium]|nr:PHP domain-containing protein [Anaeromyxobacteraceae bacterium]
FEVVSNDTAWYRTLHDRAAWRIVLAALALPFDRAQSVLWLAAPPTRELARFDEEVAARAPAPALLCSADAHGYPSYAAAFEAFSMHVPVALTGDAAADTDAVLAALLGGRAACVFDGVAPSGAVRLALGEAGGLDLAVEGPAPSGARVRLLRDGREVAAQALARGVPNRLHFCEGGCPPGAYRVEGTVDGRPWIFTNPVPLK